MRSRLILAAAFILLLISLAANVFGFRLASVYYQQLHSVRLDPLDLDAYTGDSIAPEPAQRVVVFFGDSRAQQWPAPENLPQFLFVNRGIGSQTSAQVALRFDAYVRLLEPDILLVQVCVNDLKTLPLFPEQAAQIIENCQRNLDSIIQQARSIGAWVILTTVFPVGEPGLERRPVWSDAIADSINTVNEYIHSLAADDVIILDAYALLADDRGLVRPELGLDELHLNETGYALLNEHLIALLRNMGE